MGDEYFFMRFVSACYGGQGGSSLSFLQVLMRKCTAVAEGMYMGRLVAVAMLYDRGDGRKSQRLHAVFLHFVAEGGAMQA